MNKQSEGREQPFRSRTVVGAAESRHFGLALGLAVLPASALAGSLLVGPFVGRVAATQSNLSPAPAAGPPGQGHGGIS